MGDAVSRLEPDEKGLLCKKDAALCIHSRTQRNRVSVKFVLTRGIYPLLAATPSTATSAAS